MNIMRELTQKEVNEAANQVIREDWHRVGEAVAMVLEPDVRPQQQDRFALWMAGRLAA